MAREAAVLAVRGGTRNPGSRPRRPLDYAAVATAFAREGFDRVTMDEIADHAGVAKPTLYRYFESKEELFAAALDAECERLLEHLYAAYERSGGLPLREQIRANTEACFVYARENPETFELLFQSTGTTSSALVARTFDRVIERMSAVFRRELTARDTPAGQSSDVLAAATVGASYFVARDMMRRPEWDHDAVLELITDLWTRALGGVSRETLAAVDRPAGSRRGQR